MKPFKLYIKNSRGTIYRVDKTSVKDKLPTPTDVARRIVLCNMNHLPFEPYSLTLDAQSFDKLRKEFKDPASVHSYGVYDGSDTRLLDINEVR